MPAIRCSVAPMVARTDRHFRRLMRSVTQHTPLYTEMVVASSLVRGDEAQRSRMLGFDALERPLTLQLGGSIEGELCEATALARERGFDEVNLNVGCPAKCAVSGEASFGAALMKRPHAVARLVSAMQEGAGGSMPVSVKHRIGVDDADSWEELRAFVATLATAGVARFTVHARKALLGKLTPKQNRSVPPLRHEWVYRLCEEFPELEFELNGGVQDLAEAEEHCRRGAASVMIGRAVYKRPLRLAGIDRLASLGGDSSGGGLAARSAAEVAEDLIGYESTLQHSRQLTRHMGGLFAGQPGATRWRRALADGASIEAALQKILQ